MCLCVVPFFFVYVCVCVCACVCVCVCVCVGGHDKWQTAGDLSALLDAVPGGYGLIQYGSSLWREKHPSSPLSLPVPFHLLSYIIAGRYYSCF